MNLFQAIRKNRKLLVFLICSILVVSGITIGIVTFTYNKEKTKDELEKANFTITRFDIIGAHDDILIIEGSLIIANLTESKLANVVNPIELSIKLYNQSKYLGEAVIPITKRKFSTNQTFRIELPINNEDQNSKSFLDLFSLLIRGIDFKLDFKGKLLYKFVELKGEIKFTNFLNFELIQESMQFGLTHLDFIGKNKKLGIAQFGIFNPFSSFLGLSGTGKLLIESYLFGTIEIKEELILEHGWNNFTQEINLLDVPHIAMSELFDQYNDSIQLQVDLSIRVDESIIAVNTNFLLLRDESLYIVEINSISNFDLDGVNIQVELEMFVTSNLPFALNISKISMDIKTLSDIYVGTIEWIPENITNIPAYDTVLIKNVTANFNDIDSTIIFQLLFAGAVKIDNGQIDILVYDSLIYYSFALDRVDF